MKCEFCGSEIEKDADYCVFCGSNVRRAVMSDRKNTVISFDKQRDIGSYKLKSDYKTPEEEDVVYDGSNISRPSFTTQGILSDSNNSQNKNSKTSKKVNLRKSNYSGKYGDHSKKVNLRKSNYSGKYGDHSKKVNLRKVDPSEKSENLRNEPEKSVFMPMPNNGPDPYKERNQPPVIYLEDRAILRKGFTKKQIMKLHFLKDLRTLYCVAMILLYLSLVGSLIVSALRADIYGLIKVIMLMGFTFGIQFKMNYQCAVACLIYGVLNTAVEGILHGWLWGLFVIFAAVLALNSIKRLDSLWEQYLSTGSIPYKKHEDNNNLRV